MCIAPWRTCSRTSVPTPGCLRSGALSPAHPLPVNRILLSDVDLPFLVHQSDFIFRQQMRELNDALLEKSARLAVSVPRVCRLYVALHFSIRHVTCRLAIDRSFMSCEAQTLLRPSTTSEPPFRQMCHAQRQAGCPVDQEATSTLRLLARGSASAFDPPFATSSPLAIYSRPSAATHSRHAGAPPPPPHHEAESRADDLWKAFFSPTLLDSAARVDAGDALVLSAAGHATTSSPGGARQLALRPKAGGAETTGGMLDAHTTPFGALNAAERYQGFLGSALPRGDLTRLQRALVLARLELVAAAERATGRVEPRPQDSASPPAAEDHRITERAWANVLADLRAMALAAEEAQRAARAQASRSPSAPASVSAAAPRAVDDAMRVLAARPGEQALYEDFGTAAAKTAADGRRWIKADGERADPEQADSGAEARVGFSPIPFRRLLCAYRALCLPVLV